MTFDLLWLLWVGLFLPIELPGTRLHGGTLSEHVWWAFCFKKYGVGRKLWKTRRAFFYAFWTALTLHFTIGLAAWPWLITSAIPFGAVFIASTLFEKGEHQ